MCCLVMAIGHLRGVETEQYGTMVEWRLAGGKSSQLGETLLRRHVIQQETHTKSLEAEIDCPQWIDGA
jgi:hypothetical protein